MKSLSTEVQNQPENGSFLTHRHQQSCVYGCPDARDLLALWISLIIRLCVAVWPVQESTRQKTWPSHAEATQRSQRPI